jgi:cAMP-specific phosphodiesterase 4
MVSYFHSQVGFIDYIVQPLWETWSELVYPDCQEVLDALEHNRSWCLEQAADSADDQQQRQQQPQQQQLQQQLPDSPTTSFPDASRLPRMAFDGDSPRTVDPAAS